MTVPSFRHQTILLLQRQAHAAAREERIMKMAGIITDIVQSDKNLPKTSVSDFKTQFLALPPGKAREDLIYTAAIQQGKPTNLVPVTIDGPNGSKITYKVMPDFFMIDGLRVTASPLTAQKIADHFGMMLPTAKMAQQIYQAADTKIRAIPLSSSGYTGTDGKFYSGAEVVKNHINSSDAAVHYNNLTDQEIAKKTNGNVGLIAGHGKEIVQPLGNSKDVSFGGWEGSDGKPLQPYTTAHKNSSDSHSEYAMYFRGIGNEVKVQGANGEIVNASINDLMKNPEFSKYLSNDGKINSY